MRQTPAPMPSRKRVLSEAELVACWHATEKLGWPFGPAYRLLILTGQRKREVSEAGWEEFDLSNRIWRISGERPTKNNLDHVVDLSPQAIAILEGLPRREGAELILTTNGETPISGFSKAKARLDGLMAVHLDSSVKPWRTHDLRRTVATMMGEALDVDQGVIERVLNHVSGTQSGITGVYQRQTYRQKRKAALMAWGDHLAQLLDKPNCCERRTW